LSITRRVRCQAALYPRILAGAVIAAAQVAVRRRSAANPPAPWAEGDLSMLRGNARPRFGPVLRCLSGTQPLAARMDGPDARAAPAWAAQQHRALRPSRDLWPGAGTRHPRAVLSEV